jgi:hypothetical protein
MKYFFLILNVLYSSLLLFAYVNHIDVMFFITISTSILIISMNYYRFNKNNVEYDFKDKLMFYIFLILILTNAILFIEQDTFVIVKPLDYLRNRI